MPGQILGDRYEIEQQLGKKSGRWTLLARDLVTETPVILKLLFIDDETLQDDIKLFKREIDALQTFSHPSTPQYLGYFEMELPLDGKALALIQTYVPGKSLEQHLKEGRKLNEVEAKQVARKALEILGYLHEHTPPIVHRDIKPSNLVLAEDADNIASHVCLVDFGSVKSFSSGDMTTFTLVGTDGYRPPEQLGRRAVRASDLYSLGVTLMTGITGMDASALPRRRLRIEVEDVLNLNPSFINWFKTVTEPELDKRFKTAQEALAALG
ncbi:MAG TPA: serine/threonine-protein kinase [Crinalium sp.]|jgi:serine/threonine protein kinase